MKDIEIAEVDYADAVHTQGIVAVLNSYASDPVGGAAPLSADVKARLVPALRDQPNSVVLLALDGGHPVGVAICFFSLSTFQARPLLNVHDLAVVPARRGQGAGRALLSAAERLAVRRGCCKLTLEVQDDNTRARNLYESFGFEDFVVGESAPTRFLAKKLSTREGSESNL